MTTDVRVAPEGWRFFSELKPGDQFYREQYDGPLIAVEIIRDGGERTDAMGRTFPSWWCKRLDTGQEGHVLYGPEGMARESVLV